jgi:RNA polymerase sigma-70 factor (ECF subfamily)
LFHPDRQSEILLKPGRGRRSIKRQPATILARTSVGWFEPETNVSMDDDIRQRLEDRRYAEAFELVLGQFQDKVFRLAFSMMRNETQAEDISQDVFVKIWKALPGYHGGAALSTWIYTITRNTCLTELKKRSTRPTISLQEPDLEAVADSIPALQCSDRAAGMEMDIEAMLSELPEKYRQVITLFYLEQKAYEEVAAMLGIPLGTVKTLLFRAKKELLRIGARRMGQVAMERSVGERESRQDARGTEAGSLNALRVLPNLMLW